MLRPLSSPVACARAPMQVGCVVRAGRLGRKHPRAVDIHPPGPDVPRRTDGREHPPQGLNDPGLPSSGVRPVFVRCSSGVRPVSVRCPSGVRPVSVRCPSGVRPVSVRCPSGVRPDTGRSRATIRRGAHLPRQAWRGHCGWPRCALGATRKQTAMCSPPISYSAAIGSRQWHRQPTGHREWRALRYRPHGPNRRRQIPRADPSSRLRRGCAQYRRD